MSDPFDKLRAGPFDKLRAGPFDKPNAGTGPFMARALELAAEMRERSAA